MCLYLALMKRHNLRESTRLHSAKRRSAPDRAALELMKWPRWTRNPASGVSLPGRSRRQSWLRTTLLRPLYFCARGYVQVEISATRRTICWRPVRSEEQHLAVGGDVGLYVAKRAVDRRAEIHRLRPGVIHRLARRHEQVVFPTPVRSEKKNSSSPSKRATARWSFREVLSSGISFAFPNDPSAIRSLT